MLSASLLDGPPLDLVASFDDARASSEVDPGLRRGRLSGGQIVQAFVIAAVIGVVDEAIRIRLIALACHAGVSF